MVEGERAGTRNAFCSRFAPIASRVIHVATAGAVSLDFAAAAPQDSRRLRGRAAVECQASVTPNATSRLQRPAPGCLSAYPRGLASTVSFPDSFRTTLRKLAK
jgi:hypothetical protein